MENKLGLDWSAVEKALAEGTFSGYKIGILETEKLLDELLRAKKIPGATIERKIKYIRDFLSFADKLTYSRHAYGRIMNEPHFEISREETKQIISGYWQAMLDIEETVQALSLWEKISLRLKYFAGIILKNLKEISVVFFSLTAIFWFLGETSAGQTIAKIAVQVNHFIIFKILFWGGIILGGVLLLLGIGYLILRGKKRF